jgi:hypothetical protein
MSAWNSDSFGNDDALDWLAELVDGGGVPLLKETLESVAEHPTDEILESPQCCNAIAAAEIVAAALSQTTEDEVELPDEAAEWLEINRSHVDDSLAYLAEQALRRITLNSELKELWDDEPETAEEWSSAIMDLQERLAAVH